VECAARTGYHLREADLVAEIVDPATGLRVADGGTGEVVVTTLTRQGMPLIRYRTGDLADVGSAACTCGTVLRTLTVVRGRVSGVVDIGGHRLRLAELDEALFGVESIVDFAAQIDTSRAVDRLTLKLHSRTGFPFDRVAAAAETALRKIPAVSAACAAGRLTLHLEAAVIPAAASTGSIKRRIHDTRERTTIA
jgi:phenylacetate-CoA ligase